MTMLRALLLFLGLFTLAAPAGAQSSVANPNTRVELLAESARPAPGRALTLGLRMTPRPGWHTYFQNPGESGIETRLAWTVPPGFAAAAARYPTPETFVVSGIMNYVYGHPSTLLVDLAVPAAARPGDTLPIRLKADYLVCDDELCVPESATLALNLTIGDGAADPAAAPAFAFARAALPRPLAEPATFAKTGGRFTLAAPVAADQPVSRAYFFPLVEGAIDYAAPQTVTRGGDTLRLETQAGDATLAAIPGVLRIEGGGRVLGLALTARPGPVPPPGAPLAATPAAAAAPGGTPGLPLALALAIGGGLLLNIMPCVFPILSLKALSLAKGGDERAARADANAYTAGVVLVVTALGAVILGLRAAGASVGWAFQLQSPAFIAVLVLLMTAIALNLAGLFEIRLGAAGGAGQRLTQQSGPRGAFFTGALAAIVATPCTGPFMGAALGAALVLPPAQGLAIFAGLGLGLALPFLALGYIPALRRRLPRPGPWMERFRHILAIPMFITALALAWVLGQQTGVAGMTQGLAAALLLGVGLWWLGTRQRSDKSALPAWGLAAAALAIALVPAARAPATAATAQTAQLDAKPFSDQALAQARAAKRPAFVYFTADWCITCKVNERGALADAGVAAAFKAANVTTLVGDWTNGEPAITRFLESHGRSGVPLYLFYHADGRIEALPQILTAARLKSLT